MADNIFNPYLPDYEYIPDAEPHIVGDRVYIYGSHDLFNAVSFCMGDYVCWSAPLNDLGNWKYEGVIYKREQDPSARGPRFLLGLAAPDMVQGPDGRFYLYYFMGGTGKISVAVCDEPAGKFEYYGDVSYSDAVPIGLKGEPFQFDPGVFMDDDGKLYLYTGFALRNNPILLLGRKPTDFGPMCYELDTDDMLTVRNGPTYIGVGGYKDGNTKGYEGHLFLEASSMRKFDGRYYFIYSSMNSHELCYAVSDSPTGGFSFGGVLVSNADIGIDGIKNVKRARNNSGNTHGSLICLNGKYYVFYHRQTNRKQSSRQACAEEISFVDGKFLQAKMTSQSFTDGALSGKGEYPTSIVCNLYGNDGTRFLSMIKHLKKNTPYLTQVCRDIAPDKARRKSLQYIENFCNGCIAGFKYFDLTNNHKISVVVSGNADGVIEIWSLDKSLDNKLFDRKNGKKICEIKVNSANKKTIFGDYINAQKTIDKDNNYKALYFCFKGKGNLRFYSFIME